MLKTVLLYGFALAAGAVALQWIEYQLWARAHAGTIDFALVAAAFLGLGIWIGARRFRRQYENPFFRLPITFIEIFPLGVLTSLISAALFRNPRFLAARQVQGAA